MGFLDNIAKKTGNVLAKADNLSKEMKSKSDARRIDNMNNKRLDHALRSAEVKLKEKSAGLDRREARLRPASGGGGMPPLVDMGLGLGGGKGGRGGGGMPPLIDMSLGGGGGKSHKKKKKSKKKSGDITIHIKK
jgi:hypothetical protein